MAVEQDRIETVLSIVDNYTKEIERYRTELNTVSKQINNLGNNTGGAVSGVEKLLASFGGLKGVLASLGIGLTIKELLKLGVSCVDAASEIKELDNVLEQVFERGQESVVRWADAISTNVGRASFDLQKQASIFGSIFKGAGIKTDDLQGMSTALSELAADFSSFYDNRMEEVFNALKSGITGETEPLKRYGIILNETTAAEYALSQGIKTKWKEMSEAQKQIVRFNFLMEKTTFVQGDAERTIDSYANQVKVLEAYWDSISRTLGQKFIPQGESALHTINNLMGAIDGFLNKKSDSDYIADFYSQKMAVEQLYAEYETLSKISSRTNDEENRRIEIFGQLKSMYPEIFANISKEADAYLQVKDGIDLVIASLKQKIQIQLHEDLLKDFNKEIKNASKKIGDLQNYLEQTRLNFAKTWKIPIDLIVNDKNIKAFQTGGMAEGEARELIQELSEKYAVGAEAQQKFREDALILLKEYSDLPNEIAKINEQSKGKIENIAKQAEQRNNNLVQMLSSSNNVTLDALSSLFGLQIDNKRDMDKKLADLNGGVYNAKGELLESFKGKASDIIDENRLEHLETRGTIVAVIDGVGKVITKLNDNSYQVTERAPVSDPVEMMKYAERVGNQVINGTYKNNYNKDEILKMIGGNKKVDFDAYKKTTNSGKDKNKGKEKKPVKDKWEQTFESLNKQIEEFNIKSPEMAKNIKNARSQLEKLEWDKVIDFAQALDWTQAEVIQSLIKIKETSRDLARTLGDKTAVEKYTKEIKKLNEQLYFANTSKEYKKKTEELQYNIKSDDNKEVYTDLIKNIEEYVTASKVNLDERYSEGLDDYSTYLDKLSKVFEGLEDTYDKLGLSNEKLAAVMEKSRIEREKINNSLSEKIKEIIRVGELTNKTKGEIGKEIENAMKNTNEGRAKLIFDMEKADPWLKDYVKDLKLPEISTNNQEKVVELEAKQVELQQEKIRLTEQEISQLQKDKKSTEESVKEYDSQIVRLEKLFSGSSADLRDKKSKERANEIERLYSLRALDGKRLDDINESLNSGFKTVTKNTEIMVSEAKNSNVQGKKDGIQPDLIVAGFQKYNSYLKDSYNSKAGIDFSQYDSMEKIKALYEETLKRIDTIKSGKDNAVNKSMLDVLTKLSEILKPILGSESLNVPDINNTKISELGSEKSRLKSELRAIEDKYSKYTDNRGLEGGKLAEPLIKRIAEIDESIAKLKEFGTVTSQVSINAGKTSIALGNVEEKVNNYQKAIEEQKQGIENEKRKKEENRIGDLKDNFENGIKDLFLNINPQSIQESLIFGVKDLFDKAVTGTDIGGIYRDKYNEAFGNAFREVMADFKPSGDYRKDQEEYQKRFIESLKELATSSDAAVRSIANLTLFDTVKTQLDELAGHLSTAGEVLKDDFLKNLATTVESLSALAESLKNTSLTSNSKLGGILGGVGGFLSNVTSGIGMVTGLVTTGVGLFRSAGDLLGFGSSKKQKAKNEEEKKKAAEWYEKQFKENTDLIKSINDLTGSIVDLNRKLIQNIAGDTSDKNIAKQKNYYDNLINKTGDLFDENITATGHSTSKKRRLFGSKTKDSYGTLNQSFDEYFGDAWKYTARDSKSLEQFYDSYLKNFDMNMLKKKLGKNSLDNSNIEQVKGQFLRFIDDIKTMERHSANLPKNGVLESFEGVEVLDVFELRNEYQKQLENIYKGMGKDPENYREEILNQVNALIQEGETIISAFNEVKSAFYGKIIEGDETIMSLATGMESYFTKLRTNISKVFYDINFQGLEESFNSKFANISDKLADFRLSGGKDLTGFVNENLNFWNEFTMLKSTENIKNDMNEVLDILKTQAKGAGLSDDVINAMFPDSAIEDKASDIKSALEKAMRDALDTNSFSQFSMSLGDSIYSSVKDGLIEAFYESETFKGLAEKYFLNDEYTKALEGAGSFKDAYDIIKQQLDKAEIQLQAEGLDFRGTNSSTGEYYGGLSNSYKTATGLLASEMKFDFTLNNYGFLAIDDLMKHITKTVKEELHKSSKKEV